MQEELAEDRKAPTTAQVIELLRKEGEKSAVFVAGITDDFLGGVVPITPGGTPPRRTRFDLIASVKEHEMHHRGQLMLIERMIGVVPHLTRQMQERMAQMQQRQQKN